jgi:hypothetical protein
MVIPMSVATAPVRHVAIKNPMTRRLCNFILTVIRAVSVVLQNRLLPLPVL